MFFQELGNEGRASQHGVHTRARHKTPPTNTHGSVPAFEVVTMNACDAFPHAGRKVQGQTFPDAAFKNRGVTSITWSTKRKEGDNKEEDKKEEDNKEGFVMVWDIRGPPTDGTCVLALTPWEDACGKGQAWAEYSVPGQREVAGAPLQHSRVAPS